MTAPGESAFQNSSQAGIDPGQEDTVMGSEQCTGNLQNLRSGFSFTVHDFRKTLTLFAVQVKFGETQVFVRINEYLFFLRPVLDH
jgi:hypothetical protein